MKREKWIDNAKGIAMLLVIIGHVSGGLRGLWNFQFVYGIHLVVFFFVTGYTLKVIPVNRVYLNKKFSRLMKPYFLTCLAIIVTDVLNSRIINHDGSISTATRIIGQDLLRSFFASGAITRFGDIELGTRIGAIWFLPAMFFSILFSQLILNRFQNNDFASGTALASTALLGCISARFIWLPFSIQSGMLGAFFIWIGYIARKKDVLKHIRWYHIGLAQIVLLLGIHWGYCNVGFVSGQINDIIISIVVGLSGSLLIYCISTIYPGHMLERIGQRSLTILCTHLYALETMGRYFYKVLDRLGLNNNLRVFALIFIEIIFAVAVSFFVEKLNTCYIERKTAGWLSTNIYMKPDRDMSIDIAKGILIISMIIGHFAIDDSLRKIIYSCHMVSFVFLSGLFHNESRSIPQTIQRMAKTLLLPYGICIIGTILLNYRQWSPAFIKNTVIRYVAGISFSKFLFGNFPSVGPVYFILLLFLVRLMYAIISKVFKKESTLWLITLMLSAAGLWLGKMGYWLPWSFDVACYTLVFFHLGHSFFKKGWLQIIMKNDFTYFILSPIWAYMIYLGGMKISTRQYEPYGLVIIGALAGILLIVKCAGYISSHSVLWGRFLALIGQNSLTVLIVHTLLGRRINDYVSSLLKSSGVLWMFVCIGVQVLIAILIGQIVQMKKRIRNNCILM